MEHDSELARRVAVGLGVAALFLLVAYVVLEFVAVVVLSVFLYYAVRPIHRFLARFGLPRRVRAGLALVLFGVPFIVLMTYTIAIVVIEVQAFVQAYDIQDQLVERVVAEIDVAGLDLDELQQVVAGVGAQASLGVILASLTGTVSVVSGALVQLLILVVATYYMLVDGPRLVAWLLDTYDGSGVLREFVREVDPELSLTLFGNIVNVFVTAIVGVVTFYTFNFFAPEAVQVPFPALAGALAGVGSLIPVIGIKIVYVPIAIGLAVNAWFGGDPALFVPVAVFIVVSGVVVDFIPDFFIRAHVSGDQTHTGLLMLSYIVGPIVFGFYGLFLVPILLVVVINATYVLLPYVLSGEPAAVRQSRLAEFGGSDGDETPDARPHREAIAPADEG